MRTRIMGFRRLAMDWLICIGGGIVFGAILALARIIENWCDEAEEAGVYRRK